jgi:transposase-like protein
MLPENDRKDLAIQALARSATISDLSVRHGVSRKFVYQQTRKAGEALNNAFLSTTPNEAVLFELAASQQDVAAPGDRRAGIDLPQFVSRHCLVRA